jgi:hypothetical protein
MKNALVIVLLASWGCAATGTVREAQTIRTGVDVGRLSCGAAVAKRVELTAEQRAWCEGR